MNLTFEKVQLDPSIGVIVRDRQDLSSDFGTDVQLFINLADQAGRQCFTRLTLAAGKFPMSGQVHALLPPGDEKAAVDLDDGGCHDDRPDRHG